MVKPGQRWMYDSNTHRFVLEVLAADGYVQGKVVQVFYGDTRYVGEIGGSWTLQANAEIFQIDTSDSRTMTWTLLEGQEAPK
jgi:hypothetical protein